MCIFLKIKINHASIIQGSFGMKKRNRMKLRNDIWRVRNEINVFGREKEWNQI